MRVMVAAVVLLAGCSQQADTGNAGGAALEAAAIAAEVVRDPKGNALVGLYVRDTDQLCIVATPGGGHRIGVSVDYGDQGCSGTGAVTRSGDRLSVTFDAAPECRVEAQLDGDRVIFPAAVPGACARLCTDRASLAALEVDLLSEAVSEARSMRDRRGRELCGS